MFFYFFLSQQRYLKKYILQIARLILANCSVGIDKIHLEVDLLKLNYIHESVQLLVILGQTSRTLERGSWSSSKGAKLISHFKAKPRSPSTTCQPTWNLAPGGGGLGPTCRLVDSNTEQHEESVGLGGGEGLCPVALRDMVPFPHPSQKAPAGCQLVVVLSAPTCGTRRDNQRNNLYGLQEIRGT